MISFNDYDSIMISSILLNIIFSFITTIYLFKLTNLMFKKEQLALLASVFFIFNPASIFFIAPYSESLYFMLTMMALYNLYDHKYVISTCLFSLSCLTRSNGLVNFLFFGFYIIKLSIPNLLNDFNTFNLFIFMKRILNNKNIPKLIKMICWLIITSASFLASFSVYQFYLYWKLCLKQIDLNLIPIQLLEYGRNNSYSMSEFNWCEKFMPFSYTDVQSKYWNVGFLKYWQIRQIPNFLLATPVLMISIFAIKSFLKSINRKNYLIIIFGLNDKTRTEKFNQSNNNLFGENQHYLFVFSVHLAVLTISAMFFMHVQVSLFRVKSSKKLIFYTKLGIN